ncbi:PREDICTED: protein phosphatase 1F [Bactrocera latifrons]|uniref:protein phosphatase 1F n=1 Tax=Bactrocera latifrons TaxID=174628 RepID=UPI0008DE18AC|nr:PREDICTED: protein phosphatase 1F [Bactrocera latifrons]
MSEKESANGAISAQSVECTRLREFKNYLRELVRDRVNNATNAGETNRACISRSSNETYPVCSQEVSAEIIMTVWNHLQLKRCPRYFQISILRAVVAEVEQGFSNAKECQFTVKGINDSTKTTDNETVYDLVKLQKYIVNNLEKLLTRLTDNSELSNIPNFADSEDLCLDGTKCNCNTKQPPVVYTTGHIKNKPRKMEDRHICLERFSELYKLKSTYSFYGVFDGHSGPLAASYAASQIPYLLAESLRSISNDLDDVKAYREAFEHSFLQTDKMFSRKGISSGTTAVCVLLAQQTPPSYGHLYVAWVGDSKALLVSPTVSLQLVKSHKPDAPDERKRIEMAEGGGTVLYVQGQWRVNGILNVSRSIGDYSVAPAIAEPDFVDVSLTGAHDFIVLGTDGLFDHVPENKIVDAIYKLLADTEQKIENIPKILIELAKDGDSQDNITVVIIFLKNRLDIVQNFKKY